VFNISKFLDGLGLADEVCVKLDVVNVREKPFKFLSFDVFFVLLEEEASSLLSHENIHSFQSAQGREVSPSGADTRRLQETSSTTTLTEFVHSFIAHFNANSFDARRKMVKNIQHFEVLLLNELVGLLH
jgi:hypothetical protein